jgi:hypothetical protein
MISVLADARVAPPPFAARQPPAATRRRDFSVRRFGLRSVPRATRGWLRPLPAGNVKPDPTSTFLAVLDRRLRAHVLPRPTRVPTSPPRRHPRGFPVLPSLGRPSARSAAGPRASRLVTFGPPGAPASFCSFARLSSLRSHNHAGASEERGRTRLGAKRADRLPNLERDDGKREDPAQGATHWN